MLKEYFIGVLFLCIFISLAATASHSKMGTATAFASGILVISAILLPLVDIFRDFNAEDMFDEIIGEMEYGASDSAIELAFEDGVAAYVADKYGVKRESVTVMADGFDMSFLKAERIYVTLRSDGVFLDSNRIERELAEQFTLGGACEVSYDVK